RRLILQAVGLQERVQVDLGGNRRPAALASVRMGLDPEHLEDRELVVQVRVDRLQQLGAGHRSGSVGVGSAAVGGRVGSASAARSIRRARNSRDMTVPSGTSRIRAISRYEKPPTWARTNASREGR